MIILRYVTHTVQSMLKSQLANSAGMGTEALTYTSMAEHALHAPGDHSPFQFI